MATDINKITRISVVGAGLMGHGIAQIFAAQGYEVTLADVSRELLDQAIRKIRSNLSLMARRGIGREEEIDPSLKRIKTVLSLEEAASMAQFIVEAVSENLELKQRIFRDLDSLCPSGAILATNTSVISITEIAATSKSRERILGTHFWNPPYLIPLVEVVKGRETSDEAVDTAFELLKKVGKHPVRVQKDVPGFVGNRLQHALWREAISIVERGIADAATVDECIKYGFGMRLPLLGPLENADMVGLDLTLAIHEYVLKHLESSPAPSPLLKEKVNRGELGFAKGQGFYAWTPEEAGASRQNLQEYLIGLAADKKGRKP